MTIKTDKKTPDLEPVISNVINAMKAVQILRGEHPGSQKDSEAAFEWALDRLDQHVGDLQRTFFSNRTEPPAAKTD